MNCVRIAGAALAALIVLCSPLVAQTGNLVPNGRFDTTDGITGWDVINPEFNALAFDPAHDADGCVGSGSAHGTCDPSVDFGTGEYRTCLGAASPADSFWIAGEFLFLSSAVSGRSNLTLTFWDGPNCTGSPTNGLFAGYALSSVAGWQFLAAGPITPAAGTQSAQLRVLVTQIVGAEPAVEVRFDEVRATRTNWILVEDLELGSTCRWSAAVPAF